MEYGDEWSKKEKVISKDIKIADPGIRINFSVAVASCIAKMQAILSEETAEAEANKDFQEKNL